MEIDIYKTLLGSAVAIIAFFLIRLFNRIDKIETVAYESKNRLALVELDTKNKYDHLVDRIESMFESMRDLVIEIKEINKKIK